MKLDLMRGSQLFNWKVLLREFSYRLQSLSAQLKNKPTRQTGFSKICKNL
jgi:hypothetical protein